MKNISGILVIFFACGLALLSCRKKEYPPSVVENEPVYSAEITVDGTQQKISAGRDDYYMFGSNQLDTVQVYNYMASMRKQGCTSCKALDIQINNFKDSTGFSADTSLRPGRYAYLRPDISTPVITNFSGTYSGAASDADFVWSFGDGTTGTGRNIAHMFDGPGLRTVCLTVKGNNQCVNQNCNTIDFRKNAFMANITAISTASRSAAFTASYSGGTGPYQYSWDFGDGALSTLENPVHTFPFTGAYGISLTIRDNAGKTITTRFNYKTMNDNSSCTTNFVSSSVITDPSAALVSRVKVTWTDEQGHQYASDKTAQGTDSYFEILSSEDAGTNEKGEKIRKLKVKFAALLSDGNKTVNLSDGSAVIAVTYK